MSAELELFQQLIRNACVNDGTPDSGQEVRSADTLERFFDGVDVEKQRFEPHPGRVSISFTVPGTDPDAEPLTLFGHTDVVPVDHSKWTVDPFGAELIDGKIYGRGSVDMLCITAAMAAVTREIATGPAPKGTLTFVALADEEARGGLGAKWISENQPDAFSWKNVLSEMGGSHLPTEDGSDALAVYVGEKGAAQRRITVHGDAGHGSTPFAKDSAVAKIAEVAACIARIEPEVTDDPLWQGFIEAFRFDAATSAELKRGEGLDKVGTLSGFAHAISRLTIAQTVIHAGSAINVLPSTAYLEMDIRPLPGQTDEEIDELLSNALGSLADECTIEHLISEPATVSTTDSELYRAICATYEKFMPGASVVPILAAGGSDLRFARHRGGVGYGFGLFGKDRTLADIHGELHSHDESLHLEDFELTVSSYRALVREFIN